MCSDLLLETCSGGLHHATGLWLNFRRASFFMCGKTPPPHCITSYHLMWQKLLTTSGSASTAARLITQAQCTGAKVCLHTFATSRSNLVLPRDLKGTLQRPGKRQHHCKQAPTRRSSARCTILQNLDFSLGKNCLHLLASISR